MHSCLSRVTACAAMLVACLTSEAMASGARDGQPQAAAEVRQEADAIAGRIRGVIAEIGPGWDLAFLGTRCDGGVCLVGYVFDGARNGTDERGNPLDEAVDAAMCRVEYASDPDRFTVGHHESGYVDGTVVILKIIAVRNDVPDQPLSPRDEGTYMRMSRDLTDGIRYEADATIDRGRVVALAHRLGWQDSGAGISDDPPSRSPRHARPRSGSTRRNR